MSSSNKTVFLTKSNNNLISHCKCDSALIAEPSQMDCPWCGCGWLFQCAHCRKPFTFARAEELNFTWEHLAHNDLDKKWGRKPTGEEVKEWIGFMKILLKDIQIGRQYAYIDGWVFSIDETNLQFEGWHARHALLDVPQAAAVKDVKTLDMTLRSKEYWDSRRIEDE